MLTLGGTNTYQRRNDLDALRTFAMLLGIVLHAGLSFANVPWVVQDIQHLASYLLLSMVFGCPYFL